MADGNITVKVSTQAAQDELQRLRDQNATLKRDLVYANTRTLTTVKAEAFWGDRFKEAA